MSYKFDTDAVQLIKREISGKSKTTPIYQTSAFSFKDLDDLESYYKGDKDYLYSRNGNPNTDDLGEAVAKLEGAPLGVATSSGISAILVGVLAVAKSGDHVIACDDLYGGTYQLFAKELLDFGIEVTFVSFKNIEDIKEKIKPNTKLLYSESITNPLLRVENISNMVALAKEFNLVTMIDNTFATPYLLQPYKIGVDLVVHSATKYIGGHSDVTAGVLVGSEEFLAKAKAKVINLGANLSPFEAWLGFRGLKTLSVRMERQVKNAQKLADAMKKHEGVGKVYYPEYVSKQGNGAIVTIDITGKCDEKVFFESLSLVKIVPTLAGVETTVSYPLGTSHRALPEEMQQEIGITKGLVRVSVGIEDAEDIITDFSSALKKSLL